MNIADLKVGDVVHVKADREFDGTIVSMNKDTALVVMGTGAGGHYFYEDIKSLYNTKTI